MNATPPSSKQPAPTDVNQMTVGIAAQLGLTHIIAAGVGALIWTFLEGVERWPRGALTLIGVVILSVILNLNLLRSLRLLDEALLHLANAWPLAPIAARKQGALARLFDWVNLLAEQERPLAETRQNQLEQIGEAAAQAERNRLARELHDSIKQQLFTVQVSAAAVQARWEADPAAAQTALADVRSGAKAALVEMNALLHQLAPAPLEKVGLVQALHDQAEALGYRTGAEVQVMIGDLPEEAQFPLGAQEAIFRIVQEAFSNIARHARAQQVELRLGMGDGEIKGWGDSAAVNHSSPAASVFLDITDDGQGFEETVVSTGMGLANIRQRVGQLHGLCTLTAKPGKGTQLHITIPLETARPQKTYLMMKPDYSLARLGLVSLTGGLLLTILLAYPLARLLPGYFVPNLAAGTAAVGIICVLAALVACVGVGLIGARQMRGHGRVQNGAVGAGVGLTAAAFLFAALVGAAASVGGAHTLLAYGYQPALSDLHFLYLLGDAVNGVIWWVFSGFWLTMTAGALLGGLGGLLAPVSAEKTARRLPTYMGWLSVQHLLLFYGLFSLVVTAWVFVLLGEQIADTAVRVAAEGYTLSLPVWGAEHLPVLTALIIAWLLLLSYWATARFLTHRLEEIYRRELLMGLLVVTAVTALLPVLLLEAVDQMQSGMLLAGMLALLLLAMGCGYQTSLVNETFPLQDGVLLPAWQLVNRLSLPVGAAVTFLFAWWHLNSVAVVGLFLAFVVHVSTQERQNRLSQVFKLPLSMQLSRMLDAGVPLILSGLVFFAPLSAALGMVVLVIPGIRVLDVHTAVAAGPRLIEQLHQLYQMQAILLAGVLSFGAILVGVVLLVLKISSRRQ